MAIMWKRDSDDFDNYRRWIIAVIVMFWLFALGSLIVKARRRRRRGGQPWYGTGWMAPTEGRWAIPAPEHANPPPPYSVQPQQFTGTASDGARGEGPYGELVQEPQGAYHRDEPPAGPPPGKP